MTSLRTTFFVFLLVSMPSTAWAQEETEPAEGNQEARDEARRLLTEAQAHSEAGRHALAAESYRAMYDVMHEAGLPRAPIALYSAGRALAEVPGREREARETLQHFLAESTTLTDDPQVRDWRSNALEAITELDARIPEDAIEPEEEDEVPTRGVSSASEAGSVSPIGPVLLSVGGAAVVAGLIMGAVAFVEGQDLRDRCPTETNCPGELRDDEEAARTLAIAGDVTWITGAAVAATGLVLTLVLTESGSSREQARLSLRGAPGGGLVTVQGGF